MHLLAVAIDCGQWGDADVRHQLIYSPMVGLNE
jgi:hypothetical protein